MVQLASIGNAYLALYTMPTMLRHMVQLASIGDCTFGIVYNANYAETHGTLGKYWELHFRHFTQCQLC